MVLQRFITFQMYHLENAFLHALIRLVVTPFPMTLVITIAVYTLVVGHHAT